MKAVILDAETTGFNEPEVIELAWQGYPKELNQFHSKLYKPSKPIEFGALSAHHILDEELLGCEPSSRAKFDLPPVEYMIGHNVDYDWNVLGQPQCKLICTLAMSRSLWPELDSHNLTAMIYFITEDKRAARAKVQAAHSAAIDIGLCAELLDVICKVAKLDPLDLERLYAFSEEARIPKVMTFGKYRGQPVSAVDRGWFNWYRRQPDTDPYLLEAFRRLGY